MALRVYNTLTRQKETFETSAAGSGAHVRLRSYRVRSAHVGHAMSALVFDILRRYLEYRGYQVLHVMNYTDVDDKIIQRAEQEGLPPSALG